MDLERGFRLGDWKVAPRQGTLTRGEEVSHLEPKVMAVLVCLSRHFPDVVTRDELLDEVWADLVVVDEVLSRSISMLRTHLQDNPREPTYIQTLPKVGYRLLVPVTDDSQVASPALSWRRVPVWAIIVAVLVIASATYLLTLSSQSSNACHQNLEMAAAKLQQRGGDAVRRSIVLFEEATIACPETANAHLGLANAYALLPTYSDEAEDPMFVKALGALDRVEELDGTPDRTYAIKAFISMQQMNWAKAEVLFNTAIAHDPTDAHARQWYSQFLARVGYLDKSIEQARFAVSASDGSPEDVHRLAIAYLWKNEDELSAQHFKLAIDAGTRPYVNQEAYLVLLFRQQKYQEAELVLTGFLQSRELPVAWVGTFVKAIRSRADSDIEEAISALDEAYPDYLPTSFYWGGLVLLQTEKIFAITNVLLTTRELNTMELFFASEGAVLRTNPAFSEFVRVVGLDTFWDNHGWPDACRKTDNEIVCH